MILAEKKPVSFAGGTQDNRRRSLDEFKKRGQKMNLFARSFYCRSLGHLKANALVSKERDQGQLVTVECVVLAVAVTAPCHADSIKNCA